MAIVTLITDFGQRDHYVASMKGVVLQIDPAATIIDITHQIRAQQVTEAAFVLRCVWPAFAPGAIHVVVVDPLVGTDRRIIAARYDGRIILAPDNGAVTLVHRDCRLEELYVVQNHQLFVQPVSATFHGRDVFAPVAAHLSGGLALGSVGPATHQLELLDLPGPGFENGGIVGQVIYVDHFGNLVTNLTRHELSRNMFDSKPVEIWLGQRCIGPVRQSYAEVSAGECLALMGSADLLEIAVNQGNAAEGLAAGVGSAVRAQ